MYKYNKKFKTLSAKLLRSYKTIRFNCKKNDAIINFSVANNSIHQFVMRPRLTEENRIQEIVSEPCTSINVREKSRNASFEITKSNRFDAVCR